jgi:AcrR family transcriptional regulator
MPSAPSRPAAARTRPKDRKQSILDTAARLFREDGYHDVSMTQIARAVGIVPSALYRHYRSKQDLLVATLDESLGRFEAAVAESTDLHDMVTRAAHVAVAPRAFGGLWERDAGNLDPERHDEFRTRLRALARQVADMLDGSDDDLRRFRAWAVLAVLDRPAQRALDVPAREVPPMLVEAAMAVATTAFPVDARATAPSPPVNGLPPVTRREALLSEAIALFARRGFAVVSLDDIGDAAGVAGPSIYNHFVTKHEILVRGLDRASEALWLQLGDILRRSATPGEALTDLLSGYAEFAREHTDLVTILMSQTVHLPDPERSRIGRAYHEYVQEWAALLQGVRPGLEAARASSLVELALAVTNGVTRVRHLRDAWSIPHVAALVRSVLQMPGTRPEEAQ